jgi:hypothetical protein
LNKINSIPVQSQVVIGCRSVNPEAPEERITKTDCCVIQRRKEEEGEEEEEEKEEEEEEEEENVSGKKRRINEIETVNFQIVA